MKTINYLAEKLGLKVGVLRFHGNGTTAKGYVLYSENQNDRTGWQFDLGGVSYPEIVTFEPKFYRSGKTWGVSDKRKDFAGYRELKPKQFKDFLLGK